MAFEQTQKTRVESKQYTGNWVDFIAPAGNGGPATEPYYKESEGIDMTPLAKGIGSATDTFNRGVGGRGRGGSGEDGGEFLNRAYDIVQLNTDANGVLSSKGEEAMRHLRLQMGAAGYTDSKIQSVLSAVGQDYKSTEQGLMQEAQRKHVVDEEQALAKKGVELYPELTGRTLKEQADAGRQFYKNYNVLAAAFETAINPNSAKSVHDAAISEAADKLLGMLGSNMLNQILNQEVNAENQLQVAQQITTALISSKLVTNVREAQAVGTELSEAFIGRARENRAAMEKLTLEQKKRYSDVFVEDARYGLIKANPVLAQKLALVNWSIKDLPDAYAQLLDKFDPLKFGGNGMTQYWQGAYDVNTASMGVDNGTSTIADVSARKIMSEGLKRGDVQSAETFRDVMMRPNLEGLLNRQEMVEQRGIAIDEYKKGIAGHMANELRSHVLSKTGYVPSKGKVVNGGFFDVESKINPILDKWKQAMRHIGMTDDEIVEVGKNTMSALGVKIPDNTTNPEAFYNESVRNISLWREEHPIKNSLAFTGSTARLGLETALQEFKAGEISQEEAVARMMASMADVNADMAPTGIVNTEALEDANTIDTQEGVVNADAIESSVLNSKEYADAVEAISNNNTLSANEKSIMMGEKFREMVGQAMDVAQRGFKELLGIKEANASELANMNEGVTVDMAKKMLDFTAHQEKFVPHVYEDLVGSKQIGDKRTKGSATIGYGKNLDTNPLTKDQLDYVLVDGRKLTPAEKAGQLGKTLMKKGKDIPVSLLKRLTVDEAGAHKIMQMELDKSWKACNRYVPNFKNLDPEAQMVCADIAYNAGPGFFTDKAHKTFVQHLAKGNYKSAAWTLERMKIAKQNPKRTRANAKALRSIV